VAARVANVHVLLVQGARLHLVGRSRGHPRRAAALGIADLERLALEGTDLRLAGLAQVDRGGGLAPCRAADPDQSGQEDGALHVVPRFFVVRRCRTCLTSAPAFLPRRRIASAAASPRTALSLRRRRPLPAP